MYCPVSCLFARKRKGGFLYCHGQFWAATSTRIILLPALEIKVDWIIIGGVGDFSRGDVEGGGDFGLNLNYSNYLAISGLYVDLIFQILTKILTTPGPFKKGPSVLRLKN